MNCFFITDLHGRVDRYGKLFERVTAERPAAIFIGGDLLPSPFAALRGPGIPYKDFIKDFLVKKFQRLKGVLAEVYPRVFVILGNDDSRMAEMAVLEAEAAGLWTYCHNHRSHWDEFTVYGYTYIPPSPFRLKDWERYDVTRYVRPGCIAPEDGLFTVQAEEKELKSATIEEDLKKLAGDQDMEKAIFLFHSPPHGSKLDRAALDGRMIDDLQVDVHVGSVAIQRFIARQQPLLTLHGHIHESTRLTGSWRDKLGGTESFNGSHDGPELSLVRFDPHCLGKATRELI